MAACGLRGWMSNARVAPSASRRVVVLAGLLSMLAVAFGPVEGAAATKGLCSGGRFLLAPGDRLLVDGEQTILVSTAEPFVSIPGCGELNSVRIKQRRGETTIQARWDTCGDFQNVRLRAQIGRPCTSMSGSLQAENLPRSRFRAHRSTCGDGVLDSGAGEECDDGNVSDGDGCEGTCGVSSPFVDMVFEEHSPAGVAIPVVLDGTHAVSPAGDIVGQVTAKFGLCGAATVVAGQGSAFTIRVDGSTFDLLPDDPDAVAVDGVSIPAETAFEMHRADVASGRDPDEWSVVGQALLVLHAVASTESWSANAEVARTATAAARDIRGLAAESLLFSSEVWCKVLAYSAAVAAAAIIGGVCELGIDACGAAILFTIGTVGIPCVVVVGAACAGGLFLGPELVKEGVETWWETGTVPTTTTLASSTTTTTTTTLPSSTTSTTPPSTTTTTGMTTSTTVTTTTTVTAAPTTTTTIPSCTTVRCTIESALQTAPCAGAVVPRKVTSRLERGIALSERAALSRTSKAAQKLRKKARGALKRASNMAGQLARRRGARLPRACSRQIEDAVDAVLDGLTCG